MIKYNWNYRIIKVMKMSHQKTISKTKIFYKNK